MANERDRMTDDGSTDDSMRGGMADREGGSTGRQPGSESAERSGDEASAERVRGTGDDLEDDELEETDEVDEEDEEEDGTI